MNLMIANISTSIDDPTMASVAAALGVQVSRDFGPEWSVAASVSSTRLALGGAQAPINTATDAIIYIGDAAQDPTVGVGNAYGYHFDNYGHIPYGFVFLDVCAKYGDVWSATLSHEVLELLGDPTAATTVTGPAPQGASSAAANVFYALEVCDPTQGDTYVIDGVVVSNFVTKTYFNMAGGSVRTNFLSLALAPFGLRPGGYLQYQDDAGAHQVWGSQVSAQRIAGQALLDGYRRNSRREKALLKRRKRVV